MDDLETLVRETRPAPRAAFRAELDAKVAQGFAAPARRTETSETGLLGPVLGLVAALLLVVVVALGSSGAIGGDDEESSGGSAAPSVARESGGEESTGGGGARFEGDEAGPDLAAPSGARERRGGARGGAAPPARGGPRAVDRRVTLALQTGADDFTRTTDGVIQATDTAGGVVQRSNVTERGGRGYATFDLRIPTAALDDTLAALSRLATVTERTAAAEDITGATVSARDRLADARAERRSVLRELADGATGARADRLRRRLAVLRARIAEAEADVRALRRRADLATVRVTVESTGAAGAWTPGDALRDAGRVLEVALGVTLVVLAVVAPFALIALLGAVAGRTMRRRRREAALG